MPKPEIRAEYAKGWRGRGSLQPMVDELQRQRDSRIDFTCDARQLGVELRELPVPGKKGETCFAPFLLTEDRQVGEWLTQPTFLLRQAQQQMLAKLNPPDRGVPWQFGERLMQERPEEFVELVNALFAKCPKRRFIRTLDDHVRSVLSANYRVIDNFDMAYTALDVVQKNGGQVFEAALSDSHMRLKFTDKTVWDVIETTRRQPSGGWYAGGLGNQEYLSKVAASSWGDLPGGEGTVYPCVTISNSETGHGQFEVRLGILEGICFNLATVETIAHRVHLGATMDTGLYTAETLNADSKAILLKARDAVAAAFKQDRWSKIVARVKNAQDVKVEAPNAAADNVIKQLELPESRKDELLKHFLGNDQTAWGMSQAVSRLAQDTDDPELADALEWGAGKVIKSPAMVAVKADSE